MISNVPHWLKVVSGLFLLACLLPGTAVANAIRARLSVEYVYALDGTLTGRVVNGRVQNFEYDKRGQLLAVKDAQGRTVAKSTQSGSTTTYRDAQGRTAGTATQSGGGTTYRDARGRTTGTKR